jgi:signal transduction histidine kinase
LKQAITDDEDMRYARILDADQKELYSVNENEKSQVALMVSEPVMKNGVRIGAVELGFLDVSMTQRLVQIIVFDLVIGVLLVVTFVAGSAWVSSPIRQALEDLHGFVKQVAAGQRPGEQLDSELVEVDRVGKELTDLMRRVEDARLRQVRAQQELKAAQKEMDEYTYVISHDLKEPLRGIEGFSRFLSDKYRDKLDEEGKHFIDRIRGSALRMQCLINDLLKFSRMSQQRHPLETVGFNTLLLRVRANLQYALEAKKVDLRVDKLPMVICDGTAMTEVFHNLLSNAIKYNDKPHPIIEIGCAEKPNPETGAPEHEFYVRDNGIGIKAEYFEKIFQIFQRLHRDEEGTGIGLTIVRRVVEWHGGRVWLESVEGQGTTFYFTLPRPDVTKTISPTEQPPGTTQGQPDIAQGI